MARREQYAPGTFSWVELGTTDDEGAKAFYASLFGWAFTDMPVANGGVYSMASLGGDDVAAPGGGGGGGGGGAPPRRPG
jgi:predicted enzyme related to lactoylglutathione lyase